MGSLTRLVKNTRERLIQIQANIGTGLRTKIELQTTENTKLERLITILDNDTEELKEEINIDYIDLEQLKEMFNPPTDDPSMYYVYEIQLDHVQAINKLLKDKIEFDFKANSYYVECVQLPPYDFSVKQ